MSPGRLRIAITVTVAGLVAVACAVVGMSAYRAGVDKRNDQASHDVQDKISEALYSNLVDGSMEADDVWYVQLGKDEYADPLGDVSVEAPVITVGEQALDADAPTDLEFQSEGDRWLAYGVPLADDDALVAVLWIGDLDDEIADLRLQLLALSGGLTLVAALIAFGLATIWLRPSRAAADQQREFIADAAHELRTPLSIIQASASHALSRDRSDDEYREALTEIREASEHAGESVGELLELARLDAGQATPRLAPLRLDLLLEEVASAVRVDGCVVAAVPGDAIVVEADYLLMRQVVDNFARNAAVRSSRVQLAARVEGKWAIVEVTDDGPGFDPAMLPYVFERFRRGDQRGTAGLGMAIAKSILVAHGGSCEAENNPNGGAIVRLRLKASTPKR